MITLKKFEFIDKGNLFRVNCITYVNGKKEILYYEAEQEYKQYFCDDRIDGIVVMILYRAMRGNHNIHSDIPISEKLYFQLTEYLIPELSKRSNGKFHNISLICSTISTPYQTPRKAATGISCGVDSLFTVHRHTKESIASNFKVDQLLIINTDSVKTVHDYSKRFEINAERAKLFGQKVGLPVLSINTNFRDYVESDNVRYTSECACVMAGAALLFSKLIGTYYFASSYKMDKFLLSPLADCGYHDIFSLPMFSTENTNIYSDIGASRFEKTKTITEYEPSYSFLNVCWDSSADIYTNCSVCGKCVRTMTALDVMGKLDLYKNVFDLKKYEDNKEEIWGKVLAEKDNDEFFGEVIENVEKYNFKIPENSYKIMKRICSNKKRELNKQKQKEFILKIKFKIKRILT